MAVPDPSSRSRRRILGVAVLVALVYAFTWISLWRLRDPGEGTLGEIVPQWVGIMVAAGLTLIMYSFLYRDNPLFKVAENLYVGVALGYGAVMTWRQSLRPEIVDPLFRAPTREALYNELAHRFIPILLGLMLVTRISRKHGWLSRYSYALMVGWCAGLGIPLVVHSYILQQLRASVSPLQAVAQMTAPATFLTKAWFTSAAFPALGALVILVGTVAVLFYFFFSIEHKGAGGVVSRVGIWFLMVSFGASFGYTVMGRLSLLIGRVRFLLFEWLQRPQ